MHFSLTAGERGIQWVLRKCSAPLFPEADRLQPPPEGRLRRANKQIGLFGAVGLIPSKTEEGCHAYGFCPCIQPCSAREAGVRSIALPPLAEA